MPRSAKPNPKTDVRQQPGPRLVSWAKSWKYPGLIDIALLIEAVESDTAPDSKTLRKLATALREFYCHRDTESSLKAFAGQMDIGLRKRGRHKESQGEAMKAIDAVMKFLLVERAAVANGLTPREARAFCVKQYSDDKRKPLRTVQDWRKRFEKIAQKRIDDAERILESRK